MSVQGVSSNNTINILSLPSDLIRKILNVADLKTIVAYRTISKNFRTCIDNLINKELRLIKTDQALEFYLRWGSVMGKVDWVQTIIDSNPSINLNGKMGQPAKASFCFMDGIESASNAPLHLAAMKGHHQVVEILLKNGANPDLTNMRISTTFRNGCSQVIVHPAHRETALHIAVLKNNPEIVKLLISFKADLNARNQSGCTPLTLAVISGYVSIAKILIEAGANKTIRQNCGYSPLDIAKQQNNNAMINLLTDSLCLIQ